MKLCKKTGCFGIPSEGDLYCAKHLPQAKVVKDKAKVAAPKTKEVSGKEVGKGAAPKVAKEPIRRMDTYSSNFQELVRMLGDGTCVTCKYVFDDQLDKKGFCHAGHCIVRGRHATRLLFVNCHPQCARCNSVQGRGKTGRQLEHGIYIKNRYKWLVKEIVEEISAHDPEKGEEVRGKSMEEILVEMSVPVYRLTAAYKRENADLVRQGKKKLKEGWDKEDVRKWLVLEQKKHIVEFYLNTEKYKKK